MRVAWLAIPVLGLLMIAGIVPKPGMGTGPSGFGQSSSVQNVFIIPFTSSGVTSATDLPPTISTSPTIAWLAWDPLVNNGTAGGTFTENGDPTNANSPFCPDGDWSDLTDSGDPASTSCLRAKHFDGTGDYYELSSDAGDIESGDLSACAVYKPDGAASSTYAIMGARDATDADGWLLGYTGTSGTRAWIESDTAGLTTNIHSDTYQYGWAVACATYDSGGNFQARLNNLSSGNVAYPAGTIESDTAFRVGSAGGSTDLLGDIVAAYVWKGTILTTAQVEDLTAYWAGLWGSRNEDVSTYATTGPTSCWIGGSLVEFSDNFPAVGCQTSPGSNNPAQENGFLTIASQTNSIAFSNDFSNWTAVGTSVVSCSQSATPYLDGRTTCLITDDDGAGAEYVHQDVDVTALANGDNMVLCLAARSDTGTKGIDVIMQENTGVGCSSADHNFTAQDITTSWSTYKFATTITDGTTCENLNVQIGPVAQGGDIATTSETGAAYVVVLNLGLDGITECPQAYSANTGASGVTFGDIGVEYVAEVPLVDGSGDFTGITQFYYDVMLAEDPVSAARPWHINNSASPTDFSSMQLTAGNAVQLLNGTTTYTSSAQTFTGGTVYAIRGYLDFDNDEYNAFKDGTQIITGTTAASSKTGMNQIGVGSGVDVAAQNTEGLWIKNFRVTRQ